MAILLSFTEKIPMVLHNTWALFNMQRKPFTHGSISWIINPDLRRKKIKKHGLITLIISTAYFFIITGIVIPAFNNGSYTHWYYTPIGSSPLDAIKNIILNPFHAINLLFNEEIKIRFWKYFLVTGGIFAILKPKYALLFIPLFAQKFFSEKPVHWGIMFQYSVEFAPLLALGAIMTLQKIPYRAIGYFFVIVVVIANIFILGKMRFYDDTGVYRIFNKEYYQLPVREDIVKALDIIPENASVSTQNNLVPHMANRKKIYLFPMISESEYVILNMNSKGIWPLKDQNELAAIKEKKLDNNRDYKKIYESHGIVVYERFKP